MLQDIPCSKDMIAQQRHTLKHTVKESAVLL